MENKEMNYLALRQIIRNLEELEAIPEENHRNNLPLVENLREGLAIFHRLQHDYPEDEDCHLINYCLMKLEFAQKQVEYGDEEEGLKFTKSVLSYFLKETAPRQGGK